MSGYRIVDELPPAQPKEIRFKLISFDDLNSEDADYLVKGVLPRQGLIIVWGPPKCGKSFWVFDITMHVAMGREYRGMRVRIGEIVYLALEGYKGFGRRKDAFSIRFLGDGDSVPKFKLCGASLDLVKDHAKLIADITAQSSMPACVVIDTLNRSLAGSESKDEDMSAYVRAADAVQRAFDCAVVIVHHCGVNGERPRGHTSLTGAADVQIAVSKDAAGIVTAKVELAKDMDEGATFAARLESVELGADADGDPKTSCVVIPIEGAHSAQPARKSKEPASIRAFRSAVIEALDSNGRDINVRAGSPAVRAVRLPDARVEFDRIYATGETDSRRRADAQRKAFARAMEKLAAEYPTCVRDDEEWIWAARQ